MATIKITDVYQGDSVRHENGSQDGMPVFGRFAAIVRRGEVRIADTDDGSWFIVGPLGSTLHGDMTQDEARDRAVAFAESSGWTTDKDSARGTAIDDAKRRHNLATARPGYVKKFGPAVD